MGQEIPPRLSCCFDLFNFMETAVKSEWLPAVFGRCLRSRRWPNKYERALSFSGLIACAPVAFALALRRARATIPDSGAMILSAHKNQDSQMNKRAQKNSCNHCIVSAVGIKPAK